MQPNAVSGSFSLVLRRRVNNRGQADERSVLCTTRVQQHDHPADNAQDAHYAKDDHANTLQ